MAGIDVKGGVNGLLIISVEFDSMTIINQGHFPLDTIICICVY